MFKPMLLYRLLSFLLFVIRCSLDNESNECSTVMSREEESRKINLNIEPKEEVCTDNINDEDKQYGPEAETCTEEIPIEKAKDVNIDKKNSKEEEEENYLSFVEYSRSEENVCDDDIQEMSK